MRYPCSNLTSTMHTKPPAQHLQQGISGYSTGPLKNKRTRYETAI